MHRLILIAVNLKYKGLELNFLINLTEIRPIIRLNKNEAKQEK